jgi:hypothetical protein
MAIAIEAQIANGDQIRKIPFGEYLTHVGTKWGASWGIILGRGQDQRRNHQSDHCRLLSQPNAVSATTTAMPTLMIERLPTTDASQAISRSSIHMTGLQCRNRPLLLSPHQGQATRSRQWARYRPNRGSPISESTYGGELTRRGAALKAQAIS